MGPEGECLRCWGKEFQRERVAMEQALCPHVTVLGPGERGEESVISAPEVTGRGMSGQEVSEVGAGEVVEGFAGDGEF